MSDWIKIYGTVTDFEGVPISNGTVEIKDADLSKSAYMTKTDENGNYFFEIKKGFYMALAAVKDYGISKLEYWCWNIPAFKSREINIRIDGLEVYGINAFMIQRSRPYNTIMLYFRPMSLKRYLNTKQLLESCTIIDIAPQLKLEDITVTINSETVDVLEINKVFEQGIEKNKTKRISGYLIQVENPTIESDCEYAKINIEIKDTNTGEKGEGSLFWKKNESFDFYLL